MNPALATRARQSRDLARRRLRARSGGDALGLSRARRRAARPRLAERRADRDRCSRAKASARSASRCRRSRGCRRGTATSSGSRRRIAPYAPGARRRGTRSRSPLIVRCRSAAEELWAYEQALRAPECGAAFAWLGSDDERALRRLAVAAREGRTWGVLWRRPGQHGTRDRRATALSPCAARAPPRRSRAETPRGRRRAAGGDRRRRAAARAARSAHERGTRRRRRHSAPFVIARENGRGRARRTPRLSVLTLHGNREGFPRFPP